MKIGILVSSSRLYPSLSFDFISAYSCYFSTKQRPEFSYVVEMVNTGGNYKILQQQTQALLLNPEIKIILALIDPYAAKQIEPFVNAAGKILLSCEPGAVIPGIEIPSPNHLAFSLQCGYSSVLAVKNAIEKNHTQNIYVTSFFDGGYTQCYATARVWERKEHDILLNFVLPFADEGGNLEVLQQEINRLNPNALILQNCAEYGKIFLERSKELKIPPQLPIYASSFMMEEEWIIQQFFYFENMSGFVPWHNKLSSEENISFCDLIFSDSGKPANVFHLLGWEAAMFIEKIAGVLNEKKSHPPHVLEEVSKQEFISPRGELKWNKQFRHFVSPMYEVKLNACNGFYKPELTGVIHNDLNIWLEYASDVPQGTVSRWFNTYLCPT